MYYPAELVYKNYMPEKLEPGMLFMNILHIGTTKETVELWTLERLPYNKDKFLSENGAPVELFIIDYDGTILATPEEIGWFDLGDNYDTLTNISLKELNIILNEDDGMLEIEIEEDEEENISPIKQEDKVVLRFLTYEENEI